MSRRSERVSEAIRREASSIILDELKDPRIGFITVTKATITEDLRNAVVYYSIFGDEKAKRAAKAGLMSALNFIRGELGHRLKLKFAPDLIIKEDDEFQRIQKIEDTLRKIKTEETGEDSAA